MFNQRLKEIRLSKMLTQQTVADGIGLSSTQAYSNYELGKREPDLDTLIRLADFFNVTIDYLLGKPVSDAPSPDKSEDDDDIWELRREMAERPEMKTLFSLSKHAKKKDIELVNDLLSRMKTETSNINE